MKVKLRLLLCLPAAASVIAGVICYAYYKARKGRYHSKKRLDGKMVVITGANSGIGKETAKDLSRRGATVIMCCQDTKNGEIALKEVKECSCNSNVFLRKLDLASLTSIKEFVRNYLKEFKYLHILVNNAGIMMCPYEETEDGFEMQFGVNHLGHFALTNLLIQTLVQSAPSRIINVSSNAHITFECIDLDDLKWRKRGYSRPYAYGQSKLANVLFTKQLHRLFSNFNVSSFALHPGIVNTNLPRHLPILYFIGQKIPSLIQFIVKVPEEGAQTSIYCAVEEGIEKYSGQYFKDCEKVNSSKLSCDESIAKKLWDKSEELTGISYQL